MDLAVLTQKEKYLNLYKSYKEKYPAPLEQRRELNNLLFYAQLFGQEKLIARIDELAEARISKIKKEKMPIYAKEKKAALLREAKEAGFEIYKPSAN